MNASQKTSSEHPNDCNPNMNYYDVIVIGAGVTGLYAIYRLREIGLTVQSFEEGDGVGGTWYWNRYPGCRFDSESYTYGYSFSEELLQEWDWKEHYSAQPENERYLNYVADKFDLRKHIRLSSRVSSARFDETENLWEISIEDGYKAKGKFLITAEGILSAGDVPNFQRKQNFKGNVLKIVTGDFKLFKIPVPYGHIWDSFLRVFLGLVFGILIGVPLGLFMGLNRFAKGIFDPLIELYRPVPPLAWAPLIISVLGIDNTGKVFLLFMVSLSIMIISARAGASGTQLSKIHAAHSLGASKKQILRYVIFPNSLPEILTGIRVAVGMCWGTLVAAEFLAGTTGIGFVENVAKKYFQYEVIWITIFIMGMLGLLFDVTLRKIIDKTIPWRGKG